jgi:hypothetical protein
MTSPLTLEEINELERRPELAFAKVAIGRVCTAARAHVESHERAEKSLVELQKKYSATPPSGPTAQPTAMLHMGGKIIGLGQHDIPATRMLDSAQAVEKGFVVQAEAGERDTATCPNCARIIARAALRDKPEDIPGVKMMNEEEAVKRGFVIEDIVERLKCLAKRREREGIYTDRDICEQAAEEIERLRVKAQELENERDNWRAKSE